MLRNSRKRGGREKKKKKRKENLSNNIPIKYIYLYNKINNSFIKVYEDIH